MAGNGAAVERLRQYLRELKRAARSILIGELERSLLRSDEAAGASQVLGASLVLQECGKCCASSAMAARASAVRRGCSSSRSSRSWSMMLPT